MLRKCVQCLTRRKLKELDEASPNTSRSSCCGNKCCGTIRSDDLDPWRASVSRCQKHRGSNKWKGKVIGV
ncbi:unnamed protein product [Calypogeia fissa]